MMERDDSYSVAGWMFAGALIVGTFVTGLIMGIDHGLHNDHFFGNGAAAVIGVGAGGIGALFGKVAAR